MPVPPRIVVVGSINMDLVIRCASLPVPGQTVFADDCLELPGGKGANQAVAAARAGGAVTMVGRVGSDAFSSRLVVNLQQQGVNTDHVAATPQCTSGLAVVAVEHSGENAITVVPGANGRVSRADVESAADVIRQADLLLCQLEIPVPTVLSAVGIATAADVPVILDPAPVPRDFDDALMGVDVLCPNQTEAAAILGRPVETVDDARAGVGELCRRGVKYPVITMGNQGVVASNGSAVDWIEPVEVQAVDSTAAGDAFAGALAVRFSAGDNIFAAVRFAAVAGGLATTQIGAQSAMPMRGEIQATLDR